MYFFSRKLFFFDHHAIQGENPKVSKRPGKKPSIDTLFFFCDCSEDPLAKKKNISGKKKKVLFLIALCSLF